ncbi:hypothetical protein LshimejAT787_1700460 [Lyophyllum shimeji]|uniref:Uncharacterized protein n=1 Tax=Lyophyllum shimeji TaxID=47721 RepID=A0A9P3PZE8_LYOSH|nr:hypothetical protein LshimejAT787_1700460 [Lyophyllum shimeji]
MASPITVDDRDSRITYTPNWFLAGGPDEFGSTTHGTRTAGAKATFTFTGSSVAVYGTISDGGVYKDPPVSTYSIDGASPVTYSAVAGSQAQYKQLYFQSPKLADGQHTLVITSTLESAFFWIDYIQFTPSVEAAPIPNTAISTPKSETTPPPANPDPNTSTTTDAKPTTSPSPTTGQNTSTTNNPNTSNTVTGGGSGPNTLLGSTQTPTNTTLPPSSSPKVPAGAIAGAVVGAVVIVILLAIIFILLRRQRRRKATDPTETQSGASTGVTPFLAVGPESSSVMAQTDSVHNPGTFLTSSASSPYPAAAGYGYTVHGGTSAEKAGMHGSQLPSPSNSRVTSFSSQALLSEASSASPYGGITSSKSDSSAVSGPFQPPVQPVAGPSYHQSFGAGSLYHGYLDDVPPAYHQSPPNPHALE